MVLGQELLEIGLIVIAIIFCMKLYSGMEERREEIRQQGYTERQQIKANAELRGIQIENNAMQYGFDEPPEEENQMSQLLPLLPMLGLPPEKVEMIKAAISGGGDVSSFLPLLANLKNQGNSLTSQTK